MLPSDWSLQVRASTPMFLLARRVKATGVKMVLSGEGSDEVFGGYLYFHKVGPINGFYSTDFIHLKTENHHIL